MSHVKHFLAQLAVLVETTINPIKPKTVQFSYRIYVSRCLIIKIIKIMTAALTRRSYEETFQFSAGQRTVRVSVMSS